MKLPLISNEAHAKICNRNLPYILHTRKGANVRPCKLFYDIKILNAPLPFKGLSSIEIEG